MTKKTLPTTGFREAIRSLREWRLAAELGVDPAADGRGDSTSVEIYRQMIRELEKRADICPTPTAQPWELGRQGGRWLGAARGWLQRRRTNRGVSGDFITWGDPNAIFEISAQDVEELAAEVAAATMNLFNR